MFIEIFLGFVLIYLFNRLCQKPKGLPPGEWGLPIIGKIPPMSVPLRDYFQQLRIKYGDILSIKLGSRIFIMISDFNLIKSALSKKELSGRPDFYTFKIYQYFKNKGLLTSEGKVWQANRHFSITHLREFGMGRSIIEDTITREVNELIMEIDQKLDQPCELSWNINVAVLNILWGLVASKRFNISDPEVTDIAEMINTEIDIMSGPAMLLDLFPKFEPFVPRIIKNKWMKINILERNRDIRHNFILNIIKRHESNFDSDDPKNLIDCYFKDIKTKENDEGADTDHMDFTRSINDLFVAGSETTSSTIRYIILYLIKYPEIQKKIHEEIDEVIPKDSKPELQHRDKLVFLVATLMEVQRKMSLLPVGLVHSATENTTIAGYEIPEGAVILPFLEDCHNNPKYWKKPNEFYPEHFIDDQGNLISKKEGFLPFSVGRRVCIGENLAKKELFLFMSSILQRYQISQPEGEDLQIVVDKNTLLLNNIKPFNVIFTKRV